eukprot:scaffold102540_cov63-Phaeocystis_antarctica.AAC.1
MIGRGLDLLRGASRGPADSRRQWLGPLTTDGQPHLTHQPLLARTREPRKRRSGRLSAPVAGTPNNGRTAAPDTPTTACTPQEI